MKLTLCSVCIGVVNLLIGLVQADTSVWKVSKDNRHLYLGGTVHVLSSDDYPLPSPYETVYQLSDRLIFETDLQALQGADFQMEMLGRLSYRDGKTLADVISPQTYQTLQRFCQDRGFSMASLEKFKPGLVTTILSYNELQRLGMSDVGVDGFFHARAQKDAKPIGALESIEDQLGFLQRMGEGKEDELFEYTLRDLENMAELMKVLKHAWRSGDMAEMARVAIEPYVEKFPRTMKQLLDDRNNQWISSIESMLKNDEIEFVLVGVLHFAGDQGLITQLRSRGYEIEQY